ncbi:hypothetical protein Vafri_1339, partial [Volvox africanus]
MEAQVSSWSLPALSAAFPSSLFKVSKPHGGRALMTLPAYVDYMARQADEEPLYVFDATFAEAAPGIRKLYDVPHVFTKDYYAELGAARPNFRWLVLGPARAGASWHVDPALTSAWNALLSGEVVFVPGGWWHCVLNLETSVAVTQNYVGPANLNRVIRYMADGSSTYHAAPLPYYETVREVTVWAEKYPHLTAARGEQVGPMDTSEGGEEVAVAAEEEDEKRRKIEGEEEERVEGGQKQRWSGSRFPKRQ